MEIETKGFGTSFISKELSSGNKVSILDFLKTFGINKTTNFDLYDIANKLNLRIKVLMNNELYKIEETKKHNIIINYQDNDEKGNHWCCFRNRNFYFDSFGIKPKQEVEKFLLKNYIYNTKQVQPFGTKICGILCIYVLYRLEKESNEALFKSIIEDIFYQLKSLL